MTRKLGGGCVVVAALLAVAGTWAIGSGPASAAVTCPTVNSTTGAVSPEPTSGTDWSGCNLTGAFLYDTPMTDMNLSDANLTNATLTFDNMTSTNLTDATLSGANMTGVNLTGATIAGAIMATATITNIETFNTVGAPASLPASWEDIDSFILGPTADVQYALLTDADLAGLDLDDANLGDATLTGANLSGTDLATANIDGVISGDVTDTSAPSLPSGWQLTDGYLIGASADLDGASLPGIDLSGVNLTGTILTGTDLAQANLSGATLSSSDMDSADLDQANLDSADLDGVNLSTANLTDATATSADASSVNFTDANLTDTSFTDATLTSANLFEAELSGTDLSTATLTGVESGEVTGSPSLPADWTVADGYLLGPSADLSGASLDGVAATGADLSSANLSGADLTDAVLTSAELDSANLTSANLTGAALTSADLTDATLTDANLTDANLDNATYTGAVFTGATWLNTTCPDGTNSNKYDDGCFSALDTSPPVASPSLGSAGTEVNGWFNAPVTVRWNWTDAGTINTAECTTSSTTKGNGSFTLTASCTDLAGNTGTASYSLKVDASLPVVKVTGVKAGAHYVLGKVPTAGCSTTETVSGVATSATLKVSTGGTGGVGPFTATCSGAVSVAGLAQAAPVQAKYTTGYGFGGFIQPHQGSTTATKAKDITALFRLVNSKGQAITAATAKHLAFAQDVRVTLRGPGISPANALCSWDASARAFACKLKIPAKVRTGKTNKYTITADEDLGTGFYTAPVVGRVVNPETIYFS